MARINTTATSHGNRSETYSDGSTIQYNTFVTTSETDRRRLQKMQDAYGIVNRSAGRLDTQGQCNRYFRSLPRGRSFNDLWGDNNIFLDFSPSNAVGFFGATHTNDRDICISAWCLDNQNRWMVAATVVHEFAHIGGAPGGSSHAAELAVDRCYFGEQYDPDVMGSIRDIAGMLERMA